MTTKRKAPAPKATGAPPEKPTLESLAEQLRALDVDPGWVLYAALEGEKVARGAPSDDRLRQLRTLEEERRSLLGMQVGQPLEFAEALDSLLEEVRRLEERRFCLIGEHVSSWPTGLPENANVEELQAALRPLDEELEKSRGVLRRVEEIRQTIASLKAAEAVEALRKDPRALYAPSVLEALVHAALQCRMPGYGAKPKAPFSPAVLNSIREARTRGTPLPAEVVEEDGLVGEVYVDKTTEAQRVILAASSALRSLDPSIKRAQDLGDATESLRLARRVQREADDIEDPVYVDLETEKGKRPKSAQPVKRALAKVAKERGTTVSALSKRIERARKEFPEAPWPKRKPRRL